MARACRFRVTGKFESSPGRAARSHTGKVSESESLARRVARQRVWISRSTCHHAQLISSWHAKAALRT